MLFFRILFSLAFVTILAACAGNTPMRSSPGRDLPSRAQPSSIVASDIAFARAVRDEGAEAALRRFATPGALIHLDGTAVAANSWFANGNVLPEMADWTPRAVWASCDGSLAVSMGRTRDGAGIVGSYLTAWQRQPDGSYRWTYHTRAIDDPQPPPRRRDPLPEGQDVIVVPGMDFIDGKTADCPSDAGSLPARPQGASNSTLAEDGTLQYHWRQPAGANGQVVVDYLRDGRWQQALDFSVPAATIGPEG